MNYIVGIDEVGMGPYAGEMTICGVRVPVDWSIPGLNDSKKLSPVKRKEINSNLKDVEFKLVSFSNDQIDQEGLGVCHKRGVVEIANSLAQGNEEVVMDGNLNVKHFFKYGLREGCNMRTEIKADGKYPAVMAASIIAKEYRDALMIGLAAEFPGYDWENNVGYITKAHLDGVRKLGLTKYHRKSYKVKL